MPEEEKNIILTAADMLAEIKKIPGIEISAPSFIKNPEKAIKVLERFADKIFLLESIESEITSFLGKDILHIKDVFLSGIVRGIENSTLPDEQLSVANELEQKTEKNLYKSFADIYKREKHAFQEVYSSKKQKIADEQKMLRERDKDTAKLILEYETMDFNVLSHVIRKYVENPDVPEEDKKSTLEQIKTIDKIRIAVQTGTAGSLSAAARLSESLGRSLGENLQKALPINISKDIRGHAISVHFSYYFTKLFKDFSNSGITSVLTLPNNVKALKKFAFAGLYEGIKTPETTKKSPREWKINPNAQKRKAEKKDEKLKKRELRETYGTDQPTYTQRLTHNLINNEWTQSYSMVKRMYKKHDERVEKGMDAVLAKVTAKAKSIPELESRRIMNKHYLGESALYLYDSVRAAATASTLVTHANTFRAGRFVGSKTKSFVEWMSSGITNTTEIERTVKSKEFEDAAKGLSEASPIQQPAPKSKNKKRNKSQNRRGR
jgi:hypothetical protein